MTMEDGRAEKTIERLAFLEKEKQGALSPGVGQASTPARSGLFSLLILAALTLILLPDGGCAYRTGEAWSSLVTQGAGYDFKPVTFNVQPFLLSGLIKGKNGSARDLVVYLEGDGRGVVRGRVTNDPTPNRAMGFELARSDPAQSILYLARVGQFQPSQTGQSYQAYWANKRLAEETVTAASRAIDEAKKRVGAQYVHLIGYSGGGGLAILLAERRQDVLSLTTVAGLLDTHWWVSEKNFQPLTGSLNPADQAYLLTNVPQVHFYGTEDSIIPPAMSAHFQTLAPFTGFRRVEVNTNHWKAWPELWPELLNDYLLPNREKTAGAPLGV